MELIQNGGFESPPVESLISPDPPPTFWEIHPDRSNYVLLQHTGSHSGRQCLRFNGSPDRERDLSYAEQFFPGVPGVLASGDLSLWVKSFQPTTPEVFFNVCLCYRGEPEIRDVTEHAVRAAVDWQEVIVSTRRTKPLFSIRIEASRLSNAPFLVDDISLRGHHHALDGGRLRDPIWEEFYRFPPLAPQAPMPPRPPQEASQQASPLDRHLMLTMIELLEDRLLGIERRLDRFLSASEHGGPSKGPAEDPPPGSAGPE